MPMISVREQCLRIVAERLGDFRVARGYNSDAGANVYRCRASVPTSALPSLVLWDGPETATPRFGVVDCEMSLWVTLHERTIDRSDAGVLLADLYRCVAETRVEDPIVKLIYRQGVPRYPEDGSQILQVESQWSLTYRYLRGDPFSTPS